MFRIIIIMVTILLYSSYVKSEGFPIIISNTQTLIDEIENNIELLRNIYLGKVKYIDSGELKVISREFDSVEHKIFVRNRLKMSYYKYKSYNKTLSSSGEDSSMIITNSDAETIIIFKTYYAINPTICYIIDEYYVEVTEEDFKIYKY